MGETLNIMKLYDLIKTKKKEQDQDFNSITSRIKFSDEPDANQQERSSAPDGKQGAERK